MADAGSEVDLPPLDAAHELAAGAVEAFARDGHVAVERLIAPDELAAYGPAIVAAADRCNGEVRPLEARDVYGQAFLQTGNLWCHDEVVARFVLAPRFASVAAALLGVDRVRLYHDQALIKEAGGGPTPWHQDQGYWPIDDDRTVTLWMPLEDLDPQVGSMTFASGSHRHGALSDELISAESERLLGELVVDRGFELVSHGALRAGDATFHAGWTLHRAAGNPTGRDRPVMTIIYVADGARVVDPVPPQQAFDLACWIPGAGAGDPVASEVNPVV